MSSAYDELAKEMEEVFGHIAGHYAAFGDTDELLRDAAAASRQAEQRLDNSIATGRRITGLLKETVKEVAASPVSHVYILWLKGNDGYPQSEVCYQDSHRTIIDCPREKETEQ